MQRSTIRILDGNIDSPAQNFLATESYSLRLCSAHGIQLDMIQRHQLVAVQAPYYQI